jgi:hypothetical protein
MSVLTRGVKVLGVRDETGAGCELGVGGVTEAGERIDGCLRFPALFRIGQSATRFITFPLVFY